MQGERVEDNISSVPDKRGAGERYFSPRANPMRQHPCFFITPPPSLHPPRAIVLVENWSSTLIESRLNVMNASAGSADSPPTLA